MVIRSLRYALRSLKQNPAFSITAIATLALGIGLNTSLFSLLYAAILRPLPYHRPEELAVIWSEFHNMGALRAPSSGAELREIRENTRAFQGVAGVWVGNSTLTGESATAEQLKTAFVTWNFFQVLGVDPALGRAFTREEEGMGARPAVILSHGLWQRRFGGDRAVLGRAVRMDGGDYTVVGVLSSAFEPIFPAASVPRVVDAWVPFQYDLYGLPADQYFLRLIARLKPPATLVQARLDLAASATRLRQNYAGLKDERLEFNAVPLSEDATRDIRRPVLACFLGTLAILLIACVNVANLLLIRASVRTREIAIRTSLGASRFAIARLLLVEALVLAILGSAVAVPCAIWGGRLLSTIAPARLASVGWGQLNVPVLLFAAAACLLCALFCGLVPLAGNVGADPALALRASTRVTGPGRRLRNLLIIGQIALSFALLCAATLMVRTLQTLRGMDPGFVAGKVLSFELELPYMKFGNDSRRIAFFDQLEKRLAALPGVVSAGASTHLPLADYPNWYSPYVPEGRPDNATKDLLADYLAVTPAYFQAVGARLSQGRMFDAHDTAAGRKVVIVDELLAREAWPGASAIGKRLRVEHFVDGGFVPGSAEVVGVIKGIRNHDLGRDVRAQIYIPYTQSPRFHLGFVLRSAGDPALLAQPVRRAIAEADPELAASRVLPLGFYVAAAAAPARFAAALAAMLGVLALLLAAVGLYGVVSYSVSRRTREIGVRMALGASAGSIANMVLREGLLLSALGIAAGIPCWLVISRYIQALTYDTPIADVAAYLPAAAALPAVVILACLRPAQAARSVNAADSLRTE